MSNPLPTLRGSAAQSLYPFDRIITFTTTVNTNMNGSEQRYANHPPLFGFDLPMAKLKSANKATWLSYFGSTLGQRSTDLTDTVGGVTYGNMSLDSDTLVQVNSEAQLYNQHVSMKQLQNATWSPAAAPTAFPNFSWGGVAQQPFEEGKEFMTAVGDSPFGPKYVFGYYGTGQSGFPSTGLLQWKITYGLLTDANCTTLENMFLAAQGRYYSFSFTNPINGVTSNNVRFDQDVLKIRHLTVNQKSTEITLRQTNLS